MPAVSSAACCSSPSALRPALLELDARVGVAVRLVRGALATAARADRAAFPARLGERVVALVEAARVVADALLHVADGDAVDDRLDAGHAAREHDRVLRLLLGVHPARQLDRLLADAADVDRALAQDRIVAERLEHALLEPFVRHAFILQLVVVSSSYSLKSSATAGRGRLGLRPRPAAAATHLVGEPAEAADALRDQHANGEAGDGAQQHARDRARDGRLVVVSKRRYGIGETCGEGSAARIAYEGKFRERGARRRPPADPSKSARKCATRQFSVGRPRSPRPSPRPVPQIILWVIVGLAIVVGRRVCTSSTRGCSRRCSADRPDRSTRRHT